MGQLENRHQARMAVRRYMADQVIRTLRQVVDDNERWRAQPGADAGTITGLAAIEEVIDLYDRTLTPAGADQDSCDHRWSGRNESSIIHAGRDAWCARCYAIFANATTEAVAEALA